MKKAFSHYGDILKKTERIIDSCETLDQIGSAWRFADLFENHCKKISLRNQGKVTHHKVILQYSLDGEFIKEFISICVAEREIDRQV